MSWKYSQSTGELRNPEGVHICVGFSGCDEGLNNPNLASVKNHGPIPLGIWNIAEYIKNHPRVGLCAIRLEPGEFTVAFGRSDFLIHGLNIMDPLDSSKGCPILGNCLTRIRIWQSSDHKFEVIE